VFLLRTGGGHGFLEVVCLSLVLDTVWKYTSPKHRGAEGVTELLWNPIDNSINIIGARGYRDSSSANEIDGMFLKLSENGDSLSLSIYENGSNLTFFNSTIIGNFIYVAGGEYANGNIGYNGIVCKLDLNGNVISSKLYPNHFGLRISKYSESSYLLTGTISNFGYSIPRTILVDTTGIEIFNRIDTIEYEVDKYISRRLRNGNIISVGLAYNQSPFENDSGFISGADSLGNRLWYRKYQYNQNTDFFIDFLETSDGGLLINGSADVGFDQNLWLVKLDSNGCLEPNCWVGFKDVAENNLGIKVFPNPANEWLNFKLPDYAKTVNLEVFSISGQRVVNTKLFAPLEAIQVNNLPSGLYLLKFTLGDGRSVTERVVVAR